MEVKEKIIELKPLDRKFLKINRSALFLDRDGVIIKDVGYISRPDDVSLELGIIKLLKYVHRLNIPAYIVTNQSGISRGYYTWEDFDKVNQRMLNNIGGNLSIEAIFANSHLTNEGKNWRKPNPEMILTASKNYNLKLNKSIFIGDRLSDMVAGCKSGMKTLIHVQTGHGINEYHDILKYCDKDFFKLGFLKSKIIFIKNLLEFPYELYN